MNPKNIMNLLGRLAMLKYFPASNDAVMEGLMVLVGEMCRTEDEVRWLVTRMTSGLYSEWPGPLEMRAVYCSRYSPKDGINAYSQVYPDGIPIDPRSTSKCIAGPEMKALPPGHVASADEHMEVALQIAARTNSLTCPLGGPATPEEIAAAPRWLRRIDGYE